MVIAVVISKQNEDDACVWYLINILLDCTFGLIFEWIFIRLLEIFARKFEIDELISGCYYVRSTIDFDDYSINYWIWFIQCFMWCLISSLMKVLNYLIMVLFSENFNNFGKSLLSSIDKSPELELIVVMIIIPLFLNAFQFWIIDSFLKESDESRISRLAKGQKLLDSVHWEDYFNKISKELTPEELKQIRKQFFEDNHTLQKGKSDLNLNRTGKKKKAEEAPLADRKYNDFHKTVEYNNGFKQNNTELKKCKSNTFEEINDG